MNRLITFFTILLLQSCFSLAMDRQTPSAKQNDTQLQEAIDLSRAEEESRQTAEKAKLERQRQAQLLATYDLSLAQAISLEPSQAEQARRNSQAAQRERKAGAEDTASREAIDLSNALELSKQDQFGGQESFDAVDLGDPIPPVSPNVSPRSFSDQNNGRGAAEIRVADEGKRKAERVIDTPFAQYFNSIKDTLRLDQRLLITKLVELDASHNPNYVGTFEESNAFNAMDANIIAKIYQFYPNLTFYMYEQMPNDGSRRVEHQDKPTQKSKRTKRSWVKDHRFPLALAAGAAAVLGFLLVKSLKNNK